MGLNASHRPSSHFIATEPLDRGGEAAEQRVWEAMQVAFAQRDCLGYWRYPIFSQQGQYRKEPDILIADRQLGLIVIEVKAIAIDQIVGISGHLWEYQDYYAATGNPYQQAERQLFALVEYSDREPSLQRQVSGRALVALPCIARQQWQERGFHRLPTAPPILFQEDFSGSEETEKIIRDRIQQTPSLVPGNPLADEQWQLLLAVLAGTPLYRTPPRRVLASDRSRGRILQQARDRLFQLDLEQERIAKQIPPGPQRIRGIAGSGKTVLLCQKAAHIHLKHPHWIVAFVFFSRSLYHPILQQIDKWLRYFSNNEVGYDPKNRNLRVLHAWGGKRQPGFYSTLCRTAGQRPLTANETQSRQPNEALAQACCHLLETAAIPPLFDAILLDEGQDFIVDDCNFEGKQPFYWLAYQALRPVNPAHPLSRRLIWACDEMQSLESLKVPTVGDLFGEELGHLVSGTYGCGIRKSEVLSRCYRTPHSILTAAHAIAMGWLRPGGMLTGMWRIEDWNAIGYEVEGKGEGRGQTSAALSLKRAEGKGQWAEGKGQWAEGKAEPLVPCLIRGVRGVRGVADRSITLRRDRAQSPNPIPDLWQDSCIEFQIFKNRQDELTHLAQSLIENFRNDGLRPSQDILAIVLGSFGRAKKLETEVANFLIQQGIDIYIPSTSDYNTISFQKNRYNPNIFWLEGAVTVSRIHRAKGQEAALVYILGLDEIAENESDLKFRNQLFVALTRARGWVKISGIGNSAFYDEFARVLRKNDSFTSELFRRPPQRKIAATDVGELLQRYAAGGRNFRYINLQNAQLAEVDLYQADLIGANLQGANLNNAVLDEVKLIAANLIGANLEGASLRKAKLMGANLRSANLVNADLTGADLSDTNLQGVDLTGANLTSVELMGTNLERMI
ncbi:MAG: pentapeptide repeat-containing protein [Cyanobacteriota bacterium]|nr:pentapeptide repeat-containing protein [Cyanobacteriota bacterium]